MNLSAPEGMSVNDGITRKPSCVKYMSVDEMNRVLQVGPRAEIAKADMQKAYRNVPAHSCDRWILGMEWESIMFVDGALPFGLRSAPLLFMGAAVEWVAKRRGAT